MQLEAERRRVDDLVKAVIPIGVSLMAETNFDRLLEAILVEAKSLCNADGGTLYLRTADDQLPFSILRNDSLGIALGELRHAGLLPAPAAARSVERRTQPLQRRQLRRRDRSFGQHPRRLRGRRVRVLRARLRQPHRLPLHLVPDGSAREQPAPVIGVLQLLDALDRDSGAVVPFDPSLQPIIESLSLLAAAALEAYLREERLRREIADLHIQVDESKRARQVAEIADTDYFQTLQDKVRALRSRP